MRGTSCRAPLVIATSTKKPSKAHLPDVDRTSNAQSLAALPRQHPHALFPTIPGVSAPSSDREHRARPQLAGPALFVAIPNTLPRRHRTPPLAALLLQLRTAEIIQEAAYLATTSIPKSTTSTAPLAGLLLQLSSTTVIRFPGCVAPSTAAKSSATPFVLREGSKAVIGDRYVAAVLLPLRLKSHRTPLTSRQHLRRNPQPLSAAVDRIEAAVAALPRQRPRRTFSHDSSSYRALTLEKELVTEARTARHLVSSHTLPPQTSNSAAGSPPSTTPLAQIIQAAYLLITSQVRNQRPVPHRCRRKPLVVHEGDLQLPGCGNFDPDSSFVLSERATVLRRRRPALLARRYLGHRPHYPALRRARPSRPSTSAA